MRVCNVILVGFLGTPLRVWKFDANQPSEADPSIPPLALICIVDKGKDAPEFRVIWRRTAWYFSKGDAPARVVCRLSLKFMLSKSIALQFSLVLIAPVYVGVDEDKFSNAGLDSGAQIMVTYVMCFMAILSRSESEHWLHDMHWFAKLALAESHGAK